VGADDGGDRFDALDQRGASGRELARIGFVMAGQVERDDAMTGFDQRLDENRQVRALPAPAVHQVDGRPVTP
jgi:hypothetical protein